MCPSGCSIVLSTLSPLLSKDELVLSLLWNTVQPHVGVWYPYSESIDLTEFVACGDHTDLQLWGRVYMIRTAHLVILPGPLASSPTPSIGLALV